MRIQVEVRFSGPVRRPWPDASRSLAVAAGSTVRDLLTDCGFAPHEHAFLHVAVNRATATLTTPLSGGDTVDVMLRVGGG